MILSITVALFLARVEQAHGPVSHAGLVLTAPLTEGAVVTISERAGVKVTSSSPLTPMTERQVDVYFDVFGEQLRHREQRERHRPRHKSKSEPEDGE